MKKILITAVLFCALWMPAARAQYSFSTTTAPYTNLTGGTSFHPNAAADTIIAPGFQLTINGIANDTLFIRIPFGRINTQMPNATAVGFHLFNAEQIGGAHEYTVIGAPGNRVLKLQCRGIRFAHDFTGQDSINYQVWIFESGNIVEIHFGPNSVLCPQSYYMTGAGTMNGPAIGVYGLWLTGNPAAPTTTASAGSTLNGTPANGTVYRFTPAASGIQMNGNSGADPVLLFPNPATDRLFFTGVRAGMAYVVTDIAGKAIYSGPMQDNQVDVSMLAKGAYWVALFSGNAVAVKYRFLKL